MYKPVVLFVGLETTDGLLTTWAVNHGFQELNILTAPIAGSWLFPVIKIALALLGVALLLPLAKRFPRLVNFGFVCVSVFLTLVLASNFIEMYTHFFG